MANGTITVCFTNATGAPDSQPYPNLNLDITRPIDIIVQHGGPNRPKLGKIWKMRKSNRPGDPNFDVSLNHWESFSSNGITGNADVELIEVF